MRLRPGLPKPGLSRPGLSRSGIPTGLRRPGVPGSGRLRDQGYYGGGYAPTWTSRRTPTSPARPAAGSIRRPGRFCSRCGYGFFSSEAPDPYAGTGGGWGASEAAQDRAARREYRRSLPPLYRWRRVIIGVLVVVLAGVGGGDAGPRPGRHGEGRLVRLEQRSTEGLRRCQVQVVPRRGHRPELRPGGAGGRVGRRVDDELVTEPGGRPVGPRRVPAKLCSPFRRPGSGRCRSSPAWTGTTRSGTAAVAQDDRARASTTAPASRSPWPNTTEPQEITDRQREAGQPADGSASASAYPAAADAAR